MRYLTIIILLFTLIACNNEEKQDKQQPIAKKKTVKKEFGFVLDDFTVVNDTIQSGDTFGGLLQKQGYSVTDVHNITQAIRDSFNLRDIRIGKPYTLLKNKQKPDSLEVFIYQADRLSYYVVDLRDSIAKAYKKTRPLTIKRRVIAAEIEGSLSATVQKLGSSPALTHELSEIYAWSIDFFKLQKGDKFAVTINERFISDTIYGGLESIEAAYFETKGDKKYAFPFKQEPTAKRADYYDEEGKVLKSMFLKAPLKFSRISSRFSPKRFHPVQKRWKAHNGTDYAAPTGTPIMTTASGTVIAAGYTSGNGNYVKVRHNSTYTTQYLHMSKIKVRRGQHVNQGDVIGLVGSTGLATGPHVCYRFWKNGVQVDALKQKLPTSQPMADKYKPKFIEHMTPLKKELDSISNITFNK
ncbi:peptidoglycan DD-metalloendopeptidase family protein [Flavobacterium salilacus subsp. salilacus]|uniref:peptidoglycan DD-metalloendopeptidase family protein n=1 Tax=Flavobacterium TaxID=237 RepID=UPI0010750325|nr:MULTISPECIES: peptidoglycan DD-metalloendopeptidase family protein [Flavobacterium]KAF2518298.1 peptidoglycan DD-metalloendopeptidase family protein [Flavobacterium salilacus subsp. salilacus]MBE1615288.1 peptidoglycan DD-metalloendopeptidase family protein [Flavobacterium sp. SaA2.13]